MEHRQYQSDLDDAIEDSWSRGNSNVMAVLPTGGGKTTVFSGIMKRYQKQPSVAIAHRKELVGQISVALAGQGVRHNIIGPTELVRFAIQRQRQKVGRDWYDPHATCSVASVNTLVSKKSMRTLSSWFPQVRLWVMDEGHHIVRGNVWGKAISAMTNARGLAVTATACRADGKGLGRHADGYMDDLVEGPTMRELIQMGYLCDYQIAAPLSDMQVDPEAVGKSGDYSKQQLRKAAKQSHIVGDVVENWMTFANGKRTIVFASDLDTANEILVSFVQKGVRAEMLDGGSSDHVRAEVGDRFERGDVDVLINVDLFGEGYDVPAVECIVMARPTESYGLYCQQFGRGLRPFPGKPFAMIIDHVGNIARHGLPDKARVWSLDSKERRPKAVNPEDDIPLRYCPACTRPYEKFRTACPYFDCGHEYVPAGRGSPEKVEGDLQLLSPEELARLRGEVYKVQETADAVMKRMSRAGAPRPAILGAGKNIRSRHEAQEALREWMAWWMTIKAGEGHPKRECQKLFWHLYGIDILSAQALGRPEAIALAEKIIEDIAR